MVHVNAIVDELVERLDGIADGLDLVVHQLLFLFLLHKNVKEVQ